MPCGQCHTRRGCAAVDSQQRRACSRRQAASAPPAGGRVTGWSDRRGWTLAAARILPPVAAAPLARARTRGRRLGRELCREQHAVELDGHPRTRLDRLHEAGLRVPLGERTELRLSARHPNVRAAPESLPGCRVSAAAAGGGGHRACCKMLRAGTLLPCGSTRGLRGERRDGERVGAHRGARRGARRGMA
eukprot:scaffold97158_cov63-Phaeocystis_antarctica.AAC.2